MGEEAVAMMDLKELSSEFCFTIPKLVALLGKVEPKLKNYGR